jgi:hypothetical protein
VSNFLTYFAELQGDFVTALESFDRREERNQSAEWGGGGGAERSMQSTLSTHGSEKGLSSYRILYSLFVFVTWSWFPDWSYIFFVYFCDLKLSSWLIEYFLYFCDLKLIRLLIEYILCFCDFKGTVSWDRFQKFWQKVT